MHSNAIQDELLKMDRLGRVRVPAGRREALLDAFEECGVSAMEFAAHVGVKYQTFATWRQSRARRRDRGVASVTSAVGSAAPSRPAIQWLEAVVKNPAARAGGKLQAPLVVEAITPVLRVALPGGARVEVANGAEAKLAAVLLRALEAASGAPC